MDTTCVFVKLLVIFVLALVFYKLYKQSLTEGFEDNIKSNNNNNVTNTANTNVNYLKLNETYLEPDGTKLDLLYTNYSGDELGKEIWENKTLDQCTDLCNQLDKCSGFSRELVNDDAPGKCFPRTKISNCHSNRKGDTIQMQNAIKYNSYVKSGFAQTNNVLNKCIGDTNLTLNRSVYIKSQLYPNKYIGTLGDGLAALIDINDSEFHKKCNFRIEIGKDGIGTISLLHIDSNMYLYRNSNSSKPMATMPMATMPMATMPMTTDSMTMNVMPKDTLILKNIITNKTNDRQRVSFNILDAMKNLMKFKCLSLDGETTDKYIVINPDNKNYLSCMELHSSINEQEYVFNIVDNIVKSNIISNKNNLAKISTPTMPMTTMPMTTMPMTTMPMTTMPMTTMGMGMGMGMGNNIDNMAENQKEAFIQVDAIGNVIKNNNNIPVSNLDTINDISLYKNIFTTPTNVNIGNYIDDNYSATAETGGASTNGTFFSISKKMNDIVINNQLSKSINKSQEEYDAIKKLNLEIEKEIANLNMGLNGKNDKIYHNIDKMRITDMANDYYTLKNINHIPYE
jgi:hypothetical protein